MRCALTRTPLASRASSAISSDWVARLTGPSLSRRRRISTGRSTTGPQSRSNSAVTARRCSTRPAASTVACSNGSTNQEGWETLDSMRSVDRESSVDVIGGSPGARSDSSALADAQPVRRRCDLRRPWRVLRRLRHRTVEEAQRPAPERAPPHRRLGREGASGSAHAQSELRRPTLRRRPLRTLPEVALLWVMQAHGPLARPI